MNNIIVDILYIYIGYIRILIIHNVNHDSVNLVFLHIIIGMHKYRFGN